MSNQELLKLYVDFRKELKEKNPDIGKLFFEYLAIFADKKNENFGYFLLMIRDIKEKLHHEFKIEPIQHYFDKHIKTPIKVNLSPNFIDELVNSKIFKKEDLNAILLTFFDIENENEIKNLENMNLSELIKKYNLAPLKKIRKIINKLSPENIKKVIYAFKGTMPDDLFFALWGKVNENDVKETLLSKVKITPDFIDKFNSKYKISYFEILNIIHGHNIDEEILNKLIQLSDNPDKTIVSFLSSKKIDIDKKIKFLVKNKHRLNDYFYGFLMSFTNHNNYIPGEYNEKKFFEFIDEYGQLINKENWERIIKTFKNIPIEIIDKHINNIDITNLVIFADKIDYDFLKKHIDKFNVNDLFILVILKKIPEVKLKNILDLLDNEEREKLINKINDFSIK